MKRENKNAIIVNICKSAKPFKGNALPSRFVAQVASEGDWKMDFDRAEKIEYVVSMYKRECMYAWRVVSFQVVETLINGKIQERVRFEMKPVFEGSRSILENAASSDSTKSSAPFQYFEVN